jgi:endonuclease G
MKLKLFTLLLICLNLCCFYNQNHQNNHNQAENQPPKEKFLPFGNPSNATHNESLENNYLVSGKYFTYSYNREKSLSNWIAWSIEKQDLGDVERQNDFRPDESLPKNWKRVTSFDYNGSGYSRGHMCASADRQNSVEANSATFQMTNIMPQSHSLNEGPWEKLESYSRKLARRNGKVYIIAGHYGEKGKMRSKITIPTNFWKVIAFFPRGYDAEDISEKTRIIAVDMPNNDDISETNWYDFVTSVREIEQKTGYNFFSNLPQDLQDQLETKVDSRQ